jgi:pimeloyl-ACP methyl ester carboxylesterase
MPRWLKIALGAGVVLGGAFGLFLVKRYRANSVVTPYDLAVRTVEDNAREGAALGLTPVDAAGLRGLLRAPTEGHRWVLFWGGNTSTYFKEAVATVKGLSLPPEVGVLIVAPPGYDGEGHPSPEGIERDAPRVRDWLRAQHGAERVVGVGFSMGTYSVLFAAQQHVAAVALMGVATSFETGDRNWMVHFRTPVSYRLPPLAPRIPALVVQGEHDEPGQGPTVARWLGARLVIVPGITHEETPNDPVALREVRAFVLEALAAP